MATSCARCNQIELQWKSLSTYSKYVSRWAHTSQAQTCGNRCLVGVNESVKSDHDDDFIFRKICALKKVNLKKYKETHRPTDCSLCQKYYWLVHMFFVMILAFAIKLRASVAAYRYASHGSERTLLKTAINRILTNMLNVFSMRFFAMFFICNT